MKNIIWDENELDEGSKTWECIEEKYPDATEDEKLEMVYDEVSRWKQDESDNLDKDIVLVGVATLGLWNGQHTGYKIFNNLNECLLHHCKGDSTLSVYVEDGELIARETHHDGTNVTRFYMLNGRTSRDELDERLNRAIRNGKPIQNIIDTYCVSAAPLVDSVYGW